MAAATKRTGRAVKGKFARSGKSAEALRRRSAAFARQVPSTKRMSRVLLFGQRWRPKCIVVMLHGLNDSAESCAGGVAESWVSGLEGALVVAPQSPDRSIWGDPEDYGYDWLRQPGTHDATNKEMNVRELQRVTRMRVRHVEGWLRALLRRHDRLILAGFSQGSLLAAICAARLGALGAVVCGGIPGLPVYSASKGCYVEGGWMRWEELLPAPTARAKPKFCAINGTKDWFVPRREVERMLAPFDCHWYWDYGVGHDFPDRWYKVALKWMQGLLAESS